jgi:hypothetical protein
MIKWKYEIFSRWNIIIYFYLTLKNPLYSYQFSSRYIRVFILFYSLFRFICWLPHNWNKMHIVHIDTAVSSFINEIWYFWRWWRAKYCTWSLHAFALIRTRVPGKADSIWSLLAAWWGMIISKNNWPVNDLGC